MMLESRVRRFITQRMLRFRYSFLRDLLRRYALSMLLAMCPGMRRLFMFFHVDNCIVKETLLNGAGNVLREEQCHGLVAYPLDYDTETSDCIRNRDICTSTLSEQRSALGTVIR
jgi:hypothetical protein